MYLAIVDQMAREEIAAAAAARHELGPGYDDAVAEGLIERIGAEVDRRVDARLAQRGPAEPAARPPAEPAARPGWVPAVIGVGSMACGLGATGMVVFARATNVDGQFGNSVSSAQILLVAFIWAVIAVVNVAYARRR